MERTLEGMILFVTPYQDHEIAQVFTPEGKISLIRKWGRTAKTPPLSPLTRSEFLFETGKGEIGLIKEVFLKDPYLANRNDLETLTLSMECLKALKLTQHGETPSEPLYRLLLKILSTLPGFSKKRNLLSLFYLKILLNDGLIPLEALDLEMAELALIKSLNLLSKQSYPDSFHENIASLFMGATG